MHIYIYIYIYVRTYVCICVYIYIYTYALLSPKYAEYQHICLKYVFETMLFSCH